MRLVNEFILSHLYFAFPYEAVGAAIGGLTFVVGAGVVLYEEGKCFL